MLSCVSFEFCQELTECGKSLGLKKYYLRVFIKEQQAPQRELRAAVTKHAKEDREYELQRMSQTIDFMTQISIYISVS